MGEEEMNIFDRLIPMMEETLEELAQRVPGIPIETLQQMNALDPTANQENNTTGKYTRWIVNVAKKSNEPRMFPKKKETDENGMEREIITVGEDGYKLKEWLSIFNKAKNKPSFPHSKDINQYKTTAQLYDVVKTYKPEDLKQSKTELLGSEKDVQKVFENEKWLVLIPKTYQASCRFGKGTQWCTATENTDNYYKQYSGQGPLYIVINKQNKEEKYQIHFESMQFMDIEDRPFDLDEAFDKDLKEVFSAEAMKRIKGKSKESDGYQITKNDDKITIVATIEKLGENFQGSDRSYHGELVSPQWVKSFLKGENFIEYYDFHPNIAEVADDFSDANVSALRQILSENYSEYVNGDVNSMSADELIKVIVDNDISDLHSVIEEATVRGAEAGANDECYKDIVKAIEKSGWKNLGDGNFRTELTVKGSKNLKPLMVLAGGGFDDLFSSNSDIGMETAAYNFTLAEPRYGWIGFDKERFNEHLSDGFREMESKPVKTKKPKKSSFRKSAG